MAEGIRGQQPAQRGDGLFQTVAQGLFFHHVGKDGDRLAGTVLPQQAAAAQHQGQSGGNAVAHPICPAGGKLLFQADDLEHRNGTVSAPSVGKQGFRHALDGLLAERPADRVPLGAAADDPVKMPGGIQPDQVGKEMDVVGDGVLSQVENVANPADAAAPVGPPVFCAQPALSRAVQLQQPIPVKIVQEIHLIPFAEDVPLFMPQELGTGSILHLTGEIGALRPQRVDAVQLQIGPHPHHEIGHHALRELMLLRQPAAWPHKALGQFLQHADGPHRPADVIEQHPVGDGDPAVEAGVFPPDGEIAEALNAAVQQLPGERLKPGDGIRMNPAALDQILREVARPITQGILFAVLPIPSELPGGNLHLPELFGRLVEGRLKPLDLLLLPLLRLLKLGDVRGGDEHNRSGAVIFNPGSPDAPPEPLPSARAGHAVGVLHHGLLPQAVLQCPDE